MGFSEEVLFENSFNVYSSHGHIYYLNFFWDNCFHMAAWDNVELMFVDSSFDVTNMFCLKNLVIDKLNPKNILTNNNK